ncbi:DUF2103 domain-containing protein [Fodinisporobacter ferrooxydans]|uniref:DUF2103 domain-containing protein n=1 Tax=Fodinisporobacter ferrooxydans TaxID=2901836 RepID=A0ABY4CKK3_9BACL|nr:DUF2103 domain-containing protein [Alicyclobacillaceae bacterium MYW30-H2]
MSNRHRTSKLTTKHSIIGDYRSILLDIARLDEVDSIITGVISHNKTHNTGLTFQYMTDTGIKLLAKTTQSVQEIFIVTKHRESLVDLLRGYGLIDREQKPEAPDEQQTAQASSKYGKGKKAAQSPNVQTGPFHAGRHANISKKEMQQHSESTPLSFRDHLNPELLEKLSAAKEELLKQHPPAETKQTSDKRMGTKGKRANSQSNQRDTDDDQDISMEELFNPKNDAESFADLFKSSKMDWRKFK